MVAPHTESVNLATIPAAPSRGAPGSSRVEWLPDGKMRRTPLVWSLGIMLMAYVWRVHDLYPILAKAQLPSIISLLTYALFLMDRGAQKRLKQRLKNPTLRASFILFGLMVWSIPFSLFHGLSFRFVFQDHIKVMLMMLILVGTIRGMQDLTDIAIAHVLGATIYGVLLFTRFTIGARGELYGLVFYDANDLGLLFICSLPFALFLVRKGSPTWLRLGGLFALALFCMCVVKTSSRGAFLGLLAVGLYLLLFYRGVSAGLRWGGTALGLLVIMSTSNADYWTRIATIMKPKEDYNFSGNSEAGRMEVWKRGMGYMRQRPFTGVGVQAFPVAEGTISPLASRQEWGIGLKWSAAHNSFVQIGAELGVLGLVFFTTMLLGTIKRMLKWASQLKKAKRSSEEAFAHAVVGSLLGFIVTGFFLSQAYAVFLYALLGMSAGFSAVAANAVGAAGVAPKRVSNHRRGSRSR